MEDSNSRKNIPGMSFIEPEGYVKLWVFVLLYIVTFGIYLFFWIYKTVDLLNKKTGTQDGQIQQLLLCIFVPFYTLYWLYKYSNKLVVLCDESGYRINNISNSCMVLAICGIALNVFVLFFFFYFPIGWVLSIAAYVCTIIAYALMQNAINGYLLYEMNQDSDFIISKYVETSKENGVTCSVDPVKSAIGKPVKIMGHKDNLDTDIVSQLRELKSIFDMGILTEEEFNFKKQQLLK